MKEKIQGINTKIASLSDTVEDIKQELRAEDVSFLQVRVCFVATREPSNSREPSTTAGSALGSGGALTTQRGTPSTPMFWVLRGSAQGSTAGRWRWGTILNLLNLAS